MSTVETTPPTTEGRGAVSPPLPKSLPTVDAPPSEAIPPDGAAREGSPPYSVRGQSWRRRWASTPALQALTVLLIVVVPAAGAALVSAQLPPTYGAVAEILYQGTDATSPETVDRELATQQVLLVSRPAIASASRAVGRDPVEVAKKVDTEVVEGSNVLRLQATDKSAAVARELVTSLSTQYTAVVQETAATRLDQRRQAIVARIDATNTRLSQINDRILTLSRGPAIPAGVGNTQLPLGVQAEVRTLETEAQALQQQVADLQEQAVQLDANPTTGPQIATAEVVVGPMLLPEPVGPQPLRAAAAGGLVGLLLAFVLVTLVRHRRSAEHREAAVAGP